MSGLFDNTVQTLEKSLDLTLQRHAVISDNIANAETPYFKARRLEFEAELAKAAESGESQADVAREIATVRPKISQDLESESGQDHNTVDMDREMAALTKNDLKYSAATQAINRKFSILRYAIGEGTDR